MKIILVAAPWDSSTSVIYNITLCDPTMDLQWIDVYGYTNKSRLYSI